METPPRILLIRLSSCGDILLVTPLLRALKARYPAAVIDFLAREKFAEALRHNPRINRLLCFPKNRLGALFRRGRFVAWLRLLLAFLRELRSIRYTHILDLHHVTDSALLALAARGGMRIGHRSQLLTLFFSRRAVFPVANRTAREYAALLALRMGEFAGLLAPPFPPARIRPDLHPGREALRQARAFLAEHPGAPLFVCNPGASRRNKQWPEAHWIALGKKLLRHGGRLIVIGGPDDRPAADRICRALGKNASSAIGLPLLVSFALLREAALLVTADSAALHAGVACRVPLVALFGPSNPRKFAPVSGPVRVLTAGCPQAPCSERQTRRCRRGCMAAITPEAVFTACRELLPRRERRGSR